MAIRRDAADKWFSDVVRFKGYCEHCKRSDLRLECCHIHGRRKKSVRWDLMNAVCMCSGCHRTMTENPTTFVKWLSQYFGENHLEILQEKANGILKTNDSVRKEVAKHYREEYRKLEQDPEYKPQSYI